MSGKTYAIIPVNKLDEAKTRLSGILSCEDRGELVLNMLNDVLTALNGIETIVVSPSKPTDFNDFDFHFVHEEKKEGLNKAVKKATKYAIEKGAEATLFIPADTPLLTGTHVKEIIELGKEHPLIISPSSRGGTGILYRRPPNIVDNKFSATSFSDFEEEAAKKQVPLYVYDSYSISLDIDVPDDILEFMLHGKGTETHDFLVRNLDFPLE
jgi:2-phospho-L-lactate guanylyltransferase